MLALYRTFNDEHSECNLEFQKLIKYNCELIPNTGQVKANKKKPTLYKPAYRVPQGMVPELSSLA